MREYEHFLIILSAPSGAGKSTLAKMILEKYNDIRLSVSATTRQPKGDEVDGVNYYFLSQEEFDKKAYNKEFLEYAGVYGNFYGTLKSEVEDKIKDTDVLLDVDWRGKYSICEQITDKSKIVSIFICPSHMSDLEKRLRERNIDLPEVIKLSLADARNTISHYNEYDYVVINDDIEKAFNDICAIIDYKRIINRDKKKLTNFIDSLR